MVLLPDAMACIQPACQSLSAQSNRLDVLLSVSRRVSRRDLHEYVVIHTSPTGSSFVHIIIYSTVTFQRRMSAYRRHRMHARYRNSRGWRVHVHRAMRSNRHRPACAAMSKIVRRSISGTRRCNCATLACVRVKSTYLRLYIEGAGTRLMDTCVDRLRTHQDMYLHGQIKSGRRAGARPGPSVAPA